MNKQEIIDYLKQCDLNPEKYIVLSGAAMVLLGIKESTNDIDISVTGELYKELLKNKECIFEVYDANHDKVYFLDKLNFGLSYYTEDKLYIENIPAQNIDQIRQLKQSLGRGKDKRDLELINHFEKNYHLFDKCKE